MLAGLRSGGEGGIVNVTHAGQVRQVKWSRGTERAGVGGGGCPVHRFVRKRLCEEVVLKKRPGTSGASRGLVLSVT